MNERSMARVLVTVRGARPLLLALAALLGTVAAVVLLTLFGGAGVVPSWVPLLAAGLAALAGAWSVSTSLIGAAVFRGWFAVAVWSAIGVVVAHAAFGALLTVAQLIDRRWGAGGVWQALAYSFLGVPLYSAWVTLPLGIIAGLAAGAYVRHQSAR